MTTDLNPLFADFTACVHMCLENQAFLVNYDRLKGTHFATRPDALAQMIDDASGKYADDAKELFNFIRDHVWAPVVMKQK